MKRPFESEYKSHVAYTRALEKYCDSLESQEPVCDKDPQGCWNVRCQLGKMCKNTPSAAQPPQRTWVGLTDEEIDLAIGFVGSFGSRQDARAIEAKLKEKNT